MIAADILLPAAVAAALAAAPLEPGARFEAANRAYLAGDLEAAARDYRALLDDGWESAPLHANLGNAELRMGQRGQAVASYLRALRLDPGDADARANLMVAQAENVDRVLGAESPPFLARAVERLPPGGAAATFAALWLILWLALTARRLLPHARRNVGAGAIALAAAVGVVLSGAALAARAAQLGRAEAVVVAPVAPVREAADAALKPAFELHEGTRVRVLEVRGAAARIRLANGLEGWIAAEALVAISS